MDEQRYNELLKMMEDVRQLSFVVMECSEKIHETSKRLQSFHQQIQHITHLKTEINQQTEKVKNKFEHIKKLVSF